jgi:hypothetical protein
MKKSLSEIFNWLSNPEYESQIELFKMANPNLVESETTPEEAQNSYLFSKQVLLNANATNRLNELSFLKRNQIIGCLKNIANYLQQLKRYNYSTSSSLVKQHGVGLINNILQLSDIVDESNLSKDIHSETDYTNLTKDLLKIKKRYESLIKDIETVESLKLKSFEINESLTTTAQSLNKSLQNLDQSIKSANNLRLEVEKLYGKITSTAQDVESKRVTISSTYKISNDLTKAIESSESELKKAIESFNKLYEESVTIQKESFESKIKGFEKSTSELVTKNKDLQEKVNKLLEGANAGRLYKSFHWRRRQIEKKLWIWIIGIVLINTLIVVFTLIIINGSNFLGIHALNPEKIDSAFFMKLFLTIPLLFLDWFFIKQYNINKDLIENYAYKSVISTSLLAYNQMIKEHIDDKTSLDFLIKTVDKIYTSPLDSKEYKKEYLEVLKDFSEKGLDGIIDLAKTVVKPTNK